MEAPIRLYSDWAQSLALRAATSGLGRSLRQVERRIKRWTGQPLRELRGLSRAERAFHDSIMSEKAGIETNWSEVASNTGYADQSHLCRQTRRFTGFPPEELRRRAYTDETFWVYRLWGFSDTRVPE
jgi:AraC-like DNA-binding protein